MSTTLVQISHVSGQYPDCIAVNDLSLNIHSGGVLGLLGPDGAGKTTLIKMICGLLKPTKGEVKYFFSDNTMNPIQQYIGYCPRENIVWPLLSCYEQLIFMGNLYNLKSKTSKERAEYYLAQLGLAKLRHQKAVTLDSDIKKRLAIALSLMHDPEMIILDQPLSELAPQSRDLLQQFITQVAHQKTMVLSTNEPNDIEKLSDRVAMMDHGRILLQNTPDKIKNSLGEEGVLEVSLTGNVTNCYEQLINLMPYDTYITINRDNHISIRAKDIPGYIPLISDRIRETGGKITRFEFRPHTLEDVFMQLTGRPLKYQDQMNRMY